MNEKLARGSEASQSVHACSILSHQDESSGLLPVIGVAVYFYNSVSSNYSRALLSRNKSAEIGQKTVHINAVLKFLSLQVPCSRKMISCLILERESR